MAAGGAVGAAVSTAEIRPARSSDDRIHECCSRAADNAESQTQKTLYENISNGRSPSVGKQAELRQGHRGASVARGGDDPAGPAHRRSRRGQGRQGRQGPHGAAHRRSGQFHVGQHPLARVGHGDGRRHAAQRPGRASDDDHHPARGRRVGRGHRPLRDARQGVHPLGRGDHRQDQGCRHRRHGRRHVPHARETFGASRQEGRCADHQRCGVRTLPHVGPSHDAGARRGTGRRRFDSDEGHRRGPCLHRHREQQARCHRPPFEDREGVPWRGGRAPQGTLPAGR